MSYQIFVRNVAPVVTAQDLAELFSAYGRVIDVKRPFDQKKQQPQLYAFVKMGSDEEAAAAIAGLTGHLIGGMELDVRKAEAPAERKHDGDRPQRGGSPRGQKPSFKPGGGGSRKPPGGGGGPRKAPKKPDPVRDAIWKRALEIAEILGETEKRPRAQIARIIELKSPDYADNLLHDTQSLESAGGMLTLDGERKRTLGGIFFKLAKDRLDEETRQQIFPNWRELKRRAEERKAKEKAAAESDKRRPSGHHHTRSETGGPTPTVAPPKRTISKPKVSIPTAPGGANTPAPPEVRDELNRLREAERAAQQRLSDIKSKRVKGGMLEAMKEVADLKARILQILQAYPSLK